MAVFLKHNYGILRELRTNYLGEEASQNNVVCMWQGGG